MNESKLKVKIGNLKETEYKYQSYFVKPASKFWKRLFNKRIRKGENHKKGGWWYWS